MSKLEMARVIVQALWALDDLPAQDDHRVVKFARRPREQVAYHYTTATRVLAQYAARRVGDASVKVSWASASQR